MKASMTGMGFVHLPQAPPSTQQQPPQQQHASWQQLVQEMGRVEAQHSTAGVSTAVDDSTGTARPSSSSSSSVLLPKSTQQIQACRSAAALEVLLQQSWQQMDHVHVASAFVQLARIQQQQQQASPEAAAAAAVAAAVEPECMSQAGWSMLQQVALQQLDQLQSRQVSNILWACASCSGGRLEPSDALIQGLLARSQTLLRQGTTPQGFANMLWGLASLRMQPGQEWLDVFFEASQQQLLNFQPQELSSTIWALAQLRQAPPREWYGAFLTASAAKLGACSGQSLCNLLWGVARLGLAVPEHWWGALTYACSVRAAELSPAGVCQVLWVAGMVAGKQQRRRQQQQQQLDVSAPQEQGDSQQVWGYVGSAAGTSSSSGLGAAAAAVVDSTAWLEPLLAAVEPRLQELCGAAVSTLLWALAVLGHNPGAVFVSRSLSCCSASQGGLTASNAVHALWAVTCLGEQQEAGVCWGVQELQPLLGKLQQQGMKGCKPQDFVYAAAALASLSKQQQQQVVHQVQLAQPGAQQQQQQHPEQQPVPLLPPLPLEAAPHSASLSAGGESLPPTAARCTLDSLAQQLLSASKPALQQFHLGQLCQLGRWLVAAGVRPDASWVAAFLAATAPHLHMLQPGQQLLLLHAVQHWGSTVVQQQPGWVALLLAACTSELALQGYTATHVGALLQAFAAAKLQPQPHHLQQLLQRVLQPDAALDAAGVAGVLSGLCSLGFRPPSGWVQQLWGAAAATVLRAGPEGLAAVAAVLQDPRIWELSLRPNRPFAAAFQAGIAAALPHLQPQQAAALLAGLTAAGIKPGRTQTEQLLPGLMAAAVKGLYSMPLCDVVAAWWGLVRPKVLNSAVPLDQLQVAPPAAAAQQDQQWLQQQWQALWLRRVFSSPGAVQQLAQLPAASLLQLADCIRRLQQQVSSSWADTYIAAVSVHVPGLKAHELHLLLHVLPCLEGAAAMPQFACTLMAASEPLLQSFSPTQLSDILTSIQSAGLRPPEPWLKGYVAAAAVQLGQFWPRQLTHVLTSLARLRFMPDATFLSAATEAAVNHLPKYRVEPREMVNLLWAIVALRVRPSAAWLARFEARLLERGPEQLDGQQLSRLGWCLSALQRKPGRVLWAKWLAATQAQMPGMDSSRWVQWLVTDAHRQALGLHSKRQHSMSVDGSSACCFCLLSGSGM